MARGETIVTQLKMEGAMDARDALAKATYAGMLACADAVLLLHAASKKLHHSITAEAVVLCTCRC